MARRPEKYAKISVSLPKQLATEVRKHVGGRGMSSFAARAMRRELERDRLGEFLSELEQEIGPVDEREVAEIDALWPES